MKKIALALAACLVVMLVSVGCTSGKDVSAHNGPAIIGAEGVVQPEWVMTTPKGEDVHYETGYAKLSNKANSIKRASADGKEKISQWINTTVENVVVNYTSDMGTEGDLQALEAFESISRQTSVTSLMGVTQEALWVDPDGGVWVLLSIPKENVEKAFQSASQEFERNDAARYAEYKMEEALAMLERTLANQ
ncbi:MAG: hypothetical protein RBT44_01905 [Sphaerochaetaceae bacterium]|jgi:hypothetical protein|nr:hypothetical protein [Sphaerochaetaceae bacterium]